ATPRYRDRSNMARAPSAVPRADPEEIHARSPGKRRGRPTARDRAPQRVAPRSRAPGGPTVSRAVFLRGPASWSSVAPREELLIRINGDRHRHRLKLECQDDGCQVNPWVGQISIDALAPEPSS